MTFSSRQMLMIPPIGDPLSQDNQAIGASLKKEGTCLSIDQINWPDYPYHPGVKLWTGYASGYLWLCFEVDNDHFRAKAQADQEAVWEDSCVEFFMTAEDIPDQDGVQQEGVRYRNFEFNVLGYCLSAYGTKEKRESLNPSEMKRILRFPVIDRNNLPGEGDRFNWELCAAIPLGLLGLKPGMAFRANFYKCGDLTSQPHFLSWNPIDAPSPDFHLPAFFSKFELAV